MGYDLTVDDSNTREVKSLYERIVRNDGEGGLIALLVANQQFEDFQTCLRVEVACWFIYQQ
jgi:hypothetical protein